ncbi:hypothetical protein GCM10011352_24070 [Marinobacterium zhoushanense]|uniref:Uncharacterized protein n=1 Tax=Marinobacterium zhoushanense TaxID=1679163 RepID=A0ABQ1KIQ1_9GAMM|nr:hypothetical protein GCM10011352_24070 [Marinobacterium zhoushanense]
MSEGERGLLPTGPVPTARPVGYCSGGAGAVAAAPCALLIRLATASKAHKGALLIAYSLSVLDCRMAVQLLKHRFSLIRWSLNRDADDPYR